MTDRPMTAAEVAELLGVSVKTVYVYVQRGELPARRVGPRLLRFMPEDVHALLGAART